MDFLFEETENKPTKIPKKPLSRITGGLPSKFKGASPASLFDQLSDILPDPPPERMRSAPAVFQPKPPADGSKGNRVLQQYVQADADLTTWIELAPHPNTLLSVQNRHAASINSVRRARAALGPIQKIADSLTQKVRSRHSDFLKDLKNLLPVKLAPYSRQALFARYRDIFSQWLDYMNCTIGRFMDFCTKIDSISELIAHNPDADLLVKFAADDFESWLANFETRDPVYLKLEQSLARDRRDLATRQTYGDIARCLKIAQEDFDPATNFFPDNDVVQELFESILDRDFREITQKRVAKIAKDPRVVGRLTLAIATDATRDKIKSTDRTLPVAFLMATRYVFRMLYIGRPCVQPDGEYLRRVNEMRKCSPIVFDVNPGYLKPRLRGISLDTFPQKNRYQSAIVDFRVATFQYCPLDFCQIVHRALRTIQQSASEKSWKTLRTTGKVSAKSDHLLSFDDLFDIALIVWLLAEPAAFQPLVEMFEPHIAGLELTAELEYAFTNVSALVRHVMALDFDQFVQQARARATRVIEEDPLKIDGSS
jgi:hypothetical protein